MAFSGKYSTILLIVAVCSLILATECKFCKEGFSPVMGKQNRHKKCLGNIIKCPEGVCQRFHCCKQEEATTADTAAPSTDDTPAPPTEGSSE